jgi:prepilin-type N-terminal cleavage/methylation domain-containing protein
MKQHKLEDNIDLKEKKPWSLRNNKGFSLIELMITSAIGVIVSLAIASVFIFAMEQFTVLVESNTAQENNLMITYYLRTFLSQAVDVYAETNVVNAGLPAGAGQIDINFELLTPGSWVGAAGGNVGEYGKFAIFNRETANYNNTTNSLNSLNPAIPSSVMQSTGIFVRDTDINAINPDGQSGAVVFDFNTVGGPIIPSASDIVMNRVHNFRIQRIAAGATSCPNGYAVEVVNAATGTPLSCLPAGWGPGGLAVYKVKTVTLEVTTRYFKTLPKTDWNYRYPVGGGATAVFRDIVQTVKLNLKDNLLTTKGKTGAVGDEERVHGSLYFFNYLLPPTMQ